MMKIGLTGGIGSGKSTVARVLRTMSFPVYSSDDRAKDVLASDPGIHEQVRQAFGNGVFNAAGQPDRAQLANLVFNSTQALNQLNEIIHPAVRKDFQNWMASQQGQIVFKEAAIIFEHGLEQELDAVWVVDAPAELRIARVMSRSDLTRKQVEQRIANQLSPATYLSKAAFVIQNDDRHPIIPQLIHALKSLEK
jgi:dephospho-CoA kinase